MIVGTRVRLRHDVDRFPHFVAPAGAEGTVTEIQTGLVCVRLDRYVYGAETWDNEVQWFDDMDITDDVDVLDVTHDPAIVEAILNIKDAIRRIVPFANATGYIPGIAEELSEAQADLEQAVRFLRGEEDPS